MGSFRSDIELYLLVVILVCMLAVGLYHAIGFFQRRAANPNRRRSTLRNALASSVASPLHAAGAASGYGANVVSLPNNVFNLPVRTLKAEAEIEVHAVVTSVRW